MSEEPITLTRKQWTLLFNGTEGIREIADGLFSIVEALETLGLSKAHTRLDAALSDIADLSITIERILINADDASGPVPAAQQGRAEA